MGELSEISENVQPCPHFSGEIPSCSLENSADLNSTHRELHFAPSLASQLSIVGSDEFTEVGSKSGKSEKSEDFALSRIQGTCFSKASPRHDMTRPEEGREGGHRKSKSR